MFAAQMRTTEYDLNMNNNLRQLPVDERIRLVEDLWDSIAIDQEIIQLTAEQTTELDRRLDAYEADGDHGRLAGDVLSEVRKRL